MDILIIKIMGMAFPQPFVWRNDISIALKKKYDFLPQSIIYPLGSGNAPYHHTVNETCFEVLKSQEHEKL